MSEFPANKQVVLAVWPDVVVRNDRTERGCPFGAYRNGLCVGLGSSEEEAWLDVTTVYTFAEDLASKLAVFTELLEALKSVMAGTYGARQHEGCTDCNFKRALVAIAKAEGK